jgi:hypothetical protein
MTLEERLFVTETLIEVNTAFIDHYTKILDVLIEKVKTSTDDTIEVITLIQECQNRRHASLLKTHSLRTDLFLIKQEQLQAQS